MKVRGQRTGWRGEEGEEESGRRAGLLSFLRDRDLELHSRVRGPRHGAKIAACVLVFTSQLTWEGKSLTSVGAARVHPSSRPKVFVVGYQIASVQGETSPLA